MIMLLLHSSNPPQLLRNGFQILTLYGKCGELKITDTFTHGPAALFEERVLKSQSTLVKMLLFAFRPTETERPSSPRQPAVQTGGIHAGSVKHERRKLISILRHRSPSSNHG